MYKNIIEREREGKARTVATYTLGIFSFTQHNKLNTKS